ncbi:hypothetical protein Btru_063476 [Bulinus truncatus]|nr:hypothetical protein Btru_063476 [Bulinus truncatus]
MTRKFLRKESDISIISKCPPMRKLQMCIEDMIFRILRKTRAITNVSSSNKPETKFLRRLPQNKMLQFLNIFRQSAPSSLPTLTSATTAKFLCPHHLQETRSSALKSLYGSMLRWFFQSLSMIMLADMLPSLGTWLNVANSMHSYYLIDSIDPVPSHPFSTLRNLPDISMRFSEKSTKPNECLSSMLEGQLLINIWPNWEASCDRFWKAGRQQCEALSLTGNLCTNKVHWLPTDDPTDPDDKKPVCEHSSLIRTTAACNCGRVQAEKDDPFDHKIPLQAQESAAKDSEKTDAFSTLSELSLVLSLGQLGPSAPELDPKISQIDEVREATQTQDNDFPLSDESELKNVNSRISTEEQSIKLVLTRSSKCRPIALLRQPKGCMSQMMRVYMVTPRDAANCPSVRVQISPYIHPGPHPCPLFHPGLDSPLELQPDGVWVLRLPNPFF